MSKKLFFFLLVISFLIHIAGCGVNSSYLNGKDHKNQSTGSVASQGLYTSESITDKGLSNITETASEPSIKPTTETETSPTKEPTEPQITEKTQITPTPIQTPTFFVTPTHAPEKEDIIIVAISAGKNHAAAIDNKGVLYTWGQNEYGQLGDGTTVDRSEPKPVTDIINAKSVVCGWRSTYVICDDGLVYSFGDKCYIGRDFGNNFLPQIIKELNNIIAVDTNSFESIALKNNGTVYDWGTNSRREIHELPKIIKELEGIISIAVGSGFYLAVDKNGEVWAWGWNKYFNLNTGNTEPDIYLPSKVRDVHNVKSVCGNEGEILGLHYDGNVTRWGDYELEELFESKDVISIHSGYAHFLAVKKDGTVFSWGSNMFGELGNRTAENQYEPAIIEDLSGVIAADGGTDFSVILKEDGTVWAWGRNDFGQLGNGTTENQLEPQQVLFPSTSVP